MRKIKRNMSTPENREFWSKAEEAASEVATWPDWKRAGINTAQTRKTDRKLCDKKEKDFSWFEGSVNKKLVRKIVRQNIKNDTIKKNAKQSCDYSTVEQVEPTVDNDRPRAVDMVINDLIDFHVLHEDHKICKDVRARAEVGYSRYGTYLRPENGRDNLVDAYQEIIDFAKYMRCELYRDDTTEYRQMYEAALDSIVTIGYILHSRK